MFSKGLFARIFISGLLLFSSNVFAVYGTIDYGTGIISKSMGGTGVADPEDSLASALNPAGLAFVDNQADFGVTLFSPPRGYTANPVNQFGVSPGTHWSSMNYFLSPNMGYVKPFCNCHMAFGISMYGVGGLNTWYPGGVNGATLGRGPGVFNDSRAGVDLKQMFVNIGFAWRPVSQLSFGFSLLPALQQIHFVGLHSFAPFSIDPNKVSNKGIQTSTGLGYRFGVLTRLNQYLSFGISYQPKVTMNKYSEYAGLLPHHGALDIPATGVMGVTFFPQPNVNINFDFQRVWYGQVPAYTHPSICAVTGPPCLGTADGAGFGWSTSNVYKVGVQWKMNPCWTWRAGYTYGDIPNPFGKGVFNATLNNVLSPTMTRHHITFGFSHPFNRSIIFNAEGMYAPLSSKTAINEFNPQQHITYFVRQWDIGAGITWKVDA